MKVTAEEVRPWRQKALAEDLEDIIIIGTERFMIDVFDELGGAGSPPHTHSGFVVERDLAPRLSDTGASSLSFPRRTLIVSNDLTS